ncbi:DUF674 domain-containing protein [Gossypium australe]|uniref:DUF674 domain-containing protein n=1 Tax=Gossypium australe TaxID=47621 RepID=A0A5B6WK02_9ROSI|nr:DUF674 domain-containing protein [Gossypium australe]
MVGCLGNLYDSLETMSDTYIQPTANNDTLLKPIASINAANVHPCCQQPNHQNQSKFTVVNPKKKDSSSDEGGYVKRILIYMIMDDLVVWPMSAISCIILLNRFNIKDVAVIEEKTIDVGVDEGVKLLKASLQSKTVLTDVLIEKKASLCRSKDFVDYLFSIMSLPVGTVIRLLSEQGMAGCIRNIYDGIENLGNSYMLSASNKDTLLKPQAFNNAVYVPPLLPSMQPPTYTISIGILAPIQETVVTIWKMVQNPVVLAVPALWTVISLLRICQTRVGEPSHYKEPRNCIHHMATNTVSLKLLVDSTSQRVLFAESGKDFVDFMFNILSLSVGTVTRLLTKEQMAGSLGNLYDSLENMNDTYIQPTANKDTLLKPIVPDNAANPLLPTVESSNSKPTRIYRCANTFHGSNCRLYVANDSKSICPSCNNVMKEIATVVNPKKKDSPTDEGGYVKGVITYMITDDLAVRPMSAISCITLLNKFNIKDVGVLEEKTIDIGIDKGVKLLKALLQSKTVLTDAFLDKKAGESDASNSSGVHSIVI